MNRKQQAFVCEMLRHGNKAEAYKAAYKPQSDNPRSIESAANRLMKDPEVAETIQSVQDRIYADVQEELKTHILREALTAQRKREILAQIAEGQWIMQPPPDNIEGRPTAVLIPTLKERLKAIDMDNRMTGEYANSKSTINDNNPQQSPSPEVHGGGPEEQPMQPVPDHKRHQFVIPIINSRNPLFNRSVRNNFSSPLESHAIKSSIGGGGVRWECAVAGCVRTMWARNPPGSKQ